MLKINPHPDYLSEDGRYLRGNEFSPVAVGIVSNCDDDKIPPDLENLIRAGIETGAVLSGSVQTENIGFEKIVGNITANPNIRYLILGGPDLARKAVWSCYQESPVEFRGYSLYDPGVYPEPPLSGKISWRLTQPWMEVFDEKEREGKRKAQELMEGLRTRAGRNRSSCASLKALVYEITPTLQGTSYNSIR